MRKSKSLEKNIQKALLDALSNWKKYRSHTIYRETLGFVQWISLQKSVYDGKVRLSYSIQCLATQFPNIAITLGDMLQAERGNSFWIDLEMWDKQKNNILTWVLNQTDPDPNEALTLNEVIKFLEKMNTPHIAKSEGLGIGYILNGQIASGRTNLEKVYKYYQSIEYDWGKAEASRVESWLNANDDEITSLIQTDSEKGRKLLKISD